MSEVKWCYSGICKKCGYLVGDECAFCLMREDRDALLKELALLRESLRQANKGAERNFKVIELAMDEAAAVRKQLARLTGGNY